MVMEEIWVPAVFWRNGEKHDFTGLYEVSNTGRLKSLNRTVKHRFGTQIKKGIFIKPQTIHNGYLVFNLSFENKTEHILAHRIVWESFNGKIPDGYEINHINEDKTDNRLVNLNIMTRTENCNWGTRTERQQKSMINGKLSKQVLQYDLNGNIVCEWPSLSEINRVKGYCIGNISSACNNKSNRYTPYGYIWRYK